MFNFLTSTAPTVDVQGYVTEITGALADFSTGNLITILIAGVGVAAGLVLLWFGFGYIKRKLMAALRKGKL